MGKSHLLLFHQFGIRTIVDNMCTKNRCSQRAVNLFCIQVLMFAVQDEIVAFDAQADGSLLSQENEGEYIAVLRATSA